jgi:hypothetical protein
MRCIREVHNMNHASAFVVFESSERLLIEDCTLCILQFYATKVMRMKLKFWRYFKK